MDNENRWMGVKAAGEYNAKVKCGRARARRVRQSVLVGAVVATLAFCAISAARGAEDVAKMSADDPRLFAAICLVESNNDNTAVGDNGQSVGIAQIKAGVVKDCNRIQKREKFTLEDRKSIDESRKMFLLYTQHYCGKQYTAERAARIWNGGPMGNQKDATKAYWAKVKKAIIEAPAREAAKWVKHDGGSAGASPRGMTGNTRKDNR